MTSIISVEDLRSLFSKPYGYPSPTKQKWQFVSPGSVPMAPERLFEPIHCVETQSGAIWTHFHISDIFDPFSSKKQARLLVLKIRRLEGHPKILGKKLIEKIYNLKKINEIFK